LSRGTEENHEESQDSRFPGRDLNTGHLEYEAGVLTTQPRRSVGRCSAMYFPMSLLRKAVCL
jgi:hypothetical protein